MVVWLVVQVVPDGNGGVMQGDVRSVWADLKGAQKEAAEVSQDLGQPHALFEYEVHGKALPELVKQ